MQLRDAVNLSALQDDGPNEALRPLEAAALPTSEPVAVFAGPAGPLTDVSSRDAPIDTSVPPINRDPPQDPLLAYLNAPERSDRWIGELVVRFYLSRMALTVRDVTAP